MARFFDRGDIVRVNLNPVAGHEMQGDMRPCLVISSAAFNRMAGVSYVAPITQGGSYARLAGFAVSLMNSGCKTQGVAIMSMTRPVDLAARGARKVETAPDFVVDEAVAKFTAMFEAPNQVM